MMGLFEHWPYVNFHDLNLDWVIKEIPKVFASRDEAQASAEASAESAAASQLSADASQASADASQQSANDSQQSAEDSQQSAEASAASEASAKNYADHIADPVSGLVTEWLEDNITPTTPVIDASLTVSGAAADAKVSGDKITDLKTEQMQYEKMNNDILDITYKKQYLNTWVHGSYYVITNNVIGTIDNASYMRCVKIENLKAGVYSFYNLARGYTIIEYLSDGTLHTLTDLGATTSRGTITITQDFNLYASATDPATDPMWVNDTHYPPDYIAGYYDYESAQIENINNNINGLTYGTEVISQYLTVDAMTTGSYYNVSNDTIVIANSNDYRRWAPVKRLPAGTYSYKNLTTGYTIFEYEDGTIHKLNEFGTPASGGTVTIPQNFILYATSGTNYAYTSSMFVNADSVPSQYESGVYKNGWTDVNHLMYSDPTTLFQNNTVKTIAHRGDFIAAPQCTRASYIIARKRGITIAENDLQVTSDGVYIMYHGSDLSVLGNLVDTHGYLCYTNGTAFYFYDTDNSVLYDEEYTVSSVSISTLTRCAGANYTIANMTFDRLRKISFGAYKGTEFISQTVMTFDEWILLCKQLGMDAYIDRKIAYDNTIIDSLFSIVQNLGMKDNVVWIGLSHAQAVYLRTKDSTAKFAKICAALDSALLNEWADLLATGRGVEIMYDGKTITESEVHTTLQAGYPVQIYYVDVTNLTEEQILTAIQTFVSWGVNVLSLDHYRTWDAFQAIMNEF